MPVDVPPSRPPSRAPFRRLWLWVSLGALGGGVVGGVASACGYPWSKYTVKPNRPPMFCGIVDGLIGAYNGALAVLLAALVWRGAIWMLPRRLRNGP
jgi:hypothetical protein